jgi:hypothetical protein
VRCYRVDEKAVQGIHLNESAEGLYIEVGNEQMLLEPALVQQFNAARQMVLERLHECHDAKTFMGEPLMEEELDEIDEMLEQIGMESMAVMYADIGETALIREKRRSPDALVLVETAPGIGGKIAFKSTTFDEHIDRRSNRVRRKYREEFPPPGIQIVKEGQNNLGGKSFLLRMMPSSSFRMERTGTLDDAPNVLTVVWKGQKGVAGAPPLVVFSPARLQHHHEPQEQSLE